MIARLIEGLLAALLAPSCALCDRVLDAPLEGPVCAPCWARVPRYTAPLCARCGDALPSARAAAGRDGVCAPCTVALGPIAAARAVGPYEGALADLVHACKYARRPTITRGLGRLMRLAARDLGPLDLAVPVPLHPARERERGFNQATLLARAMALPVAEALARRVRTPPQAAATAAARHANVRGAFALGRDAAKVRGRRVVLVDDVLTTGATLVEAAETLAAAGPREILAVTAARAALHHPQRATSIDVAW